MTEYSSFVQILRLRASSETRAWGYTFVGQDWNEQFVSWFDLDRKAQIVAQHLQQLGSTGEPILIAHSPGLSYIVALFGCWYAGSIAVPIYPPKKNSTAERVHSILADSGARIVLTDSAVGSYIQNWRDLGSLLVIVDTDLMEMREQPGWAPSSAIGPQTIALLQYTSGSTGSPKGVIITHSNLLHNSSVMKNVFSYDSSSRVISWLPMYHDMGLIGGLLQPLYGGFPCVLMDPSTFIRRPAAWLEAISRYRGTISGAPNFAYDLCIRRISASEKASLDLSSWQIAFNGAESVRVQTMIEFAEAFRQCGFRSSAFLPCYGLAEATLIVASGDSANILPAGEYGSSRELRVSNPLPAYKNMFDQEVVIVDPKSRRAQPSGETGEVWLTGPSVGHGYWGKPKESRDIFGARLRQPANDSKFLRTGDLGFLLNGSLHVTGRLKDLIIINGQNHYPQDVELTVERSHSALRPQGGAAFSIDLDGKESLVIVHEIDRARVNEADEVYKSVREAVSRVHELVPYSVNFIKPGTLPKTSSGKVRRSTCRDAFLEHQLETVWHSKDVSKIAYVEERDISKHRGCEIQIARSVATVEIIVREQAARILSIDVDEIQPSLPLTASGFDSLKAFEFQHCIERAFGIALPIADLLGELPLSELARQIFEKIERGSSSFDTPAASVSLDKVSGAPLSFQQERIWLFHQLFPGNTAHTLAAAVRIDGPLDTDVFVAAWNEVLRRHDILRALFPAVEGTATQTNAESASLSTIFEDLPASDEALDRIIESELNSPFDLTSGCLIRVRVIRETSNRHSMVLAIHHMAGDAWSIGVLIHDFAKFYRSRKTGVASALAPSAFQYRDVAAQERQKKTNGSEHLSYWRAHLGGSTGTFCIPTDHPKMSARRFTSASVKLELLNHMVASLQKLARQEGATLFMVLMAGFNALLARYTGKTDVIVAFPTAGRATEVENVVGFFARDLVLRTDVSSARTFLDLVRAVRSAALQAYAHEDVTFADLVAAARPNNDTRRTLLTNVAFTVLPRMEPLEAADLTLTASIVAGGTQGFDLFCTFSETLLGMSCRLTYDCEIFERSTIEALANAYKSVLENLIDNPEGSPLDLQVPICCPGDVLAENPSESSVLSISSTFTAEPLRESLDFWMDQLHIGAQIEFAPYDHVFQSLVSPHDRITDADVLARVVLIRLEDWIGSETASADSRLPETVSMFTSALESAVNRQGIPILVCVCPASRSVLGDPKLRQSIGRAALLLEASLAKIVGVTLETPSAINERYELGNYENSYTYELAKIPYNDRCFACIGTALARRLRLLKSPPLKVIAVDCDNCLWKGICGEDGPNGIELDQSAFELQTVLRAQHAAGVLICIVSKNNESDVKETFRLHPEMPIQLDHIVAHKIDWHPKSENITALARDLSLSLESFVFIDDDPFECAEVRARCPGVQVLQLPGARSEIRPFLQHVWAFDTGARTAEDENRTASYRDALQRLSIQSQVHTMEEFLSALGLRTTIEPLSPDCISRVSRLTVRTNQFNLNKKPMSEAELTRLHNTGSQECLVASVSDRFGDYGIVGVMIFRIVERVCEVDTFLLSCRALGRRVEDEMLAHIGRISIQRGCNLIRLIVQQSAVNQRGVEWVERLHQLVSARNESESPYEFDAPRVAEQDHFRLCENDGVRSEQSQKPPTTLAHSNTYVDFGRIASDFRDPDQILSAIDAWRMNKSALQAATRECRLLLTHRVHARDISIRLLEQCGHPTIGVVIPTPPLGNNSLESDEIKKSLQAKFPDLAAEIRTFFVEAGNAEMSHLASAAHEGRAVAPQTAIQQKLAVIWAEFLGPIPSIHSDFFDVGGDSLMATRILSRIRECFGVELSFNVFFTQSPTIASLAQAIDEREIRAASTEEITQALTELDGLSEQELRHLLES